LKRFESGWRVGIDSNGAILMDQAMVYNLYTINVTP